MQYLNRGSNLSRRLDTNVHYSRCRITKCDSFLCTCDAILKMYIVKLQYKINGEKITNSVDLPAIGNSLCKYFGKNAHCKLQYDSFILS